MKHKILTYQKEVLKSLGCRAQEEREGGTEQGRRNIDRQTFYRYRGGEDWVGRDMKGRGGYKSFYNRWKYTEGMDCGPGVETGGRRLRWWRCGTTGTLETETHEYGDGGSGGYARQASEATRTGRNGRRSARIPPTVSSRLRFRKRQGKRKQKRIK